MSLGMIWFFTQDGIVRRHSTISYTAGSVDVEMLAKRLIFALIGNLLSGGIFRMDGWWKIIHVAL